MLNIMRMCCLLAICITATCVPSIADEPLIGEMYPANTRPKITLQQEAEFSTNAIAFSPDSKTVVTAGVLTRKDKTSGIVKVRMWDTQTGQLLRELQSDVPLRSNLLQQLEDPLNGSDSLLVSYSPDGKTIAVSTGVVSLWDAETGNLLRTVSWFQITMGLLYEEFVTSVAFSPDSKTLVVGITSGYNKVRVFDVQTGKQLRVLPAANFGNFVGGSSLPVVLSPDGKIIATGGISVRLWDIL